MAMSVGGRKAATINVTPMIDVLLVLLIIFMIVVNRESFGMDAQVPQPPKDAARENNQDIVLFVRADQSITLNEESIIDETDLQARLATVFKTRGNHIVFVGADPDIEFQPIIHVIDVARGIGLDRIALLPRGPKP